VAKGGNHIRGLHIFTFNELARTEAWRRALLASLGEQGAGVSDDALFSAEEPA
jgi:methylenetetrahydrofolate reductase (NADPH)